MQLKAEKIQLTLLGTSLDSSLGDLTGFAVGLFNRLDHTNSDGLSHVTDGKSTKGRVVGEGFNTEGLGRHHLDKGGVTGLDDLHWRRHHQYITPRKRRYTTRLTFGSTFDGFTSSTIDLFLEGVKLASNVGSVTIKHRCVTGTNLSRVVEDDDLGDEGSGFFGRIVLGVTANVTTTDILDGDVLNASGERGRNHVKA